MDIRLKVLEGASAGQQIRIDRPRFFIGRAEDCQLRPKSEMVSRHHCAVMIDESAVVLRDLGSRNGTLVNGERVIGERELLTGDQLQIGPLRFEVLISQAEVAKKRPKVSSIKEAVARTAEGTPHEEVDPTAWLAPEADKETPPGTAQRETVALPPQTESPETEEIELSTSTTMVGPLPGSPSQAAMQPPASGSASEATPPDGVDKPATFEKAAPSKPKRPIPPKPQSDDSGAAAADAIRKFLRRR